MNFEWQTEEEQEWAEGPSPALPSRSARWPARILLSVILLVAALTLLGYRVTRLRLEQAVLEAEAGVLAAHQLLETAVARQDTELLRTLTASRADWRQLQLLSANEGVAWLEPGLEQPEHQPFSLVPQISLSPDLQQALLTYTIPYTTSAPSGAAQSIDLVRSATYRRQDEQWQWAAPGPEFWGKALTEGDEQLLIVYPERDRQWGERLAADLRPRVNRLCALLECPPSLRYQIRFERQPVLAHTFSNPRWGLLTVSLPAPSLLGRPVDEAGYQALLREYTRRLAASFVDYLLPLEWPEPGHYLAALQRQLRVALELDPWPPVSPGQTLPLSQDLLLLCTQGLRNVTTFWRYESETAQWQRAFSAEQALRMAPLPDDSGVFFQEETLRSADRQPQTWLWGPDHAPLPVNELFLLGTSDNPPLLHAADSEHRFSDFDLSSLEEDCTVEECSLTPLLNPSYTLSPDGRYGLVQSGENIHLADRHSGQRTAVGQGFNPFWLDDNVYGFVETANRPGAFSWDYQLVLKELAGGQKQVLATRDDLVAPLPPERQPPEQVPYISSVIISPALPDTIFVLGTLFQRYETQQPLFDIFLAALNRQTGTSTASFYLKDVQVADSPRLSPDGRWLTFTGYNPQTMAGNLYLFDLLAGQMEKIPFQSRYPYLTPPYDWSADGRWLLLLDEGLLQLQAPGTGQGHTVAPPLPGCAAAVWID